MLHRMRITNSTNVIVDSSHSTARPRGTRWGEQTKLRADLAKPQLQALPIASLSSPSKCTKAEHENPEKPAGVKIEESVSPTKAVVPPLGF